MLSCLFPSVKSSWPTVEGLLFVVLICVSSIPDLSAQTPSSSSSAKRVVQQVGLDQHLGAQIPLDLKFRDSTGKAVVLKDLIRNKPVILTLVYFRCPMLCTQVLNGLLESSQAIPFSIGNEYEIVSVSIDPNETLVMAAEKKKRYVGSYYRPGADAGWHFLTGEQNAIDQLAKSVGFRYVHDEHTNQFAHASGIVVLTPEGKISRYHYGIDYPPEALRLSLVESSQSRIGSVVDQFLLLCYHYDPATGRYGFAIETAIRIAGLIMIGVLTVFLWRMYRLERSRIIHASERHQTSAIL